MASKGRIEIPYSKYTDPGGDSYVEGEHPKLQYDLLGGPNELQKQNQRFPIASNPIAVFKDTENGGIELSGK